MPAPDSTTTPTLAALIREGDILDNLVHHLPPERWSTPTPATGWTVAHQIAHLAWTDEAACAALSSTPDGGPFTAYLDAAAADPAGLPDRTAAEGAAAAPTDLLTRWRRTRSALADQLHAALRDSPGHRFPWFGPPMGARSMATARLMETWAHGQDVADALDVTRPVSHGLRDIAHLGVATAGFAYAINGEEPPETAFRIELTGPEGQLWTWGPGDGSAAGTLRAPALDFCLLVTQRREPEALALEVEGDEIRRWVSIAQVFAGPPKSVMRNR
ncbi:TIGR03084 family metal-binding protein [uncultured Corynebacterium sp.]|uniref:TIGR03084 family metal-binding protein n=1 Tax=uncultured Corynebacterium sp. TaxID=159447 RepID=UPI0025D9CF1F|nr:TIGR03084 family metal-binding protein [uncultured Corynebacterium sp.]